MASKICNLFAVPVEYIHYNIVEKEQTMQSSRRVTSSVFRQSTRAMSKKYPHKPRNEAFVPRLVNYYNVEDQNMFAAIVGYGTLGALIAFAVSGEKPPREDTVGGNVEGVLSMNDPGFSEWIGGNGGKNFEMYILSFDKK